jgi:hypothetical protein
LLGTVNPGHCGVDGVVGPVGVVIGDASAQRLEPGGNSRGKGA